MEKKKFAYLHDHTIFSIKDATSSTKDYAKKINNINDTSNDYIVNGFAITDHGCMFGMTNGYEDMEAVKYKNFKYIVGNELYCVDDLNTSNLRSSEERYHLIALAKNDIGLSNLFRISSHAGMNKIKHAKKEFQITDENYVFNNCEGIIFLSACYGGKLSSLVRNNKIQEAKEYALKCKNTFDDYYIELQCLDWSEQYILNDQLVKIAKELDIPLAITCDAHYANVEDKEYHDLMKVIDGFQGFETNNEMKAPEIIEKYCIDNNIPLEAMSNTAKIAEMCNVDIKPKDPKGFMPDFPCPEGYNEESYLRKLAMEGLTWRWNNTTKRTKPFSVYLKRMYYELDIINQMGFSGYFLILMDWCKWCRDNGILLGPGRG